MRRVGCYMTAVGRIRSGEEGNRLTNGYRSAAALILAVLLIGAALWRFFPGSAPQATQTAQPGARRPATPVAAEDARVEDFPVVLTGIGTVVPLATSIVKSQISGQLLEVNFVEGQMVKAGDLLAQVDPRPYRLALAQNEAQLQRDLAILRNAERDLQRYRSVSSRVKYAVSTQQIDTQESLVSQYKGLVAIDEAMVDAARLNLAYCRITSLIDGRAGLRQVDPGNFVGPNDQNGVVVVTQLNPITVVFIVPESRLQPVLRRFRSGAKLGVAAFDHGHVVELAKGELFAIDNQIDSSTGTVKLRARFANDDEKLYPNQFVNIDLVVETLRDAVTIPRAAVQSGAQGPFVFVIGPGDKVGVRRVTLGPSRDGRVVVEEGLKAGERVVTEGADNLREGAVVSVPDPAPANHQKPAKGSAS
jgi:multidrug efflux system membrane fusion protein